MTPCGVAGVMVLLDSVLVTKTCTQQLQQNCERNTAMRARQALARATHSWTRIRSSIMQQKGTYRLRSSRCSEHRSTTIDKQSDVHYRDSLVISCSDRGLRASDNWSRLCSQLWVPCRKHGCPLPACRNSSCVTYNHYHSLSRPLCMHNCLCQAALSTTYNHPVNLSHTSCSCCAHADLASSDGSP